MRDEQPARDAEAEAEEQRGAPCVVSLQISVVSRSALRETAPAGAILSARQCVQAHPEKGGPWTQSHLDKAKAMGSMGGGRAAVRASKGLVRLRI